MKLQEQEMLIPNGFFDESTLLMVDIPFCFQNKKISKNFIHTLNKFTDNKYDVRIKLKTKKVKTLFNLKDKNPYPSCVIYQGICRCGETYVGETKRNVEIRWREAKHLRNFTNHTFKWNILCQAPQFIRERKHLEGSYIAILSPSLNNQLESKSLIEMV